MRSPKINKRKAAADNARGQKPIAQQLAAAASLIRRSASKAYPRLTGVSTLEGEVLRCIGLAGQTAARDVSRTSTLNEGLVSVTVRGLITKGLIRRIQDPADSRRRLLTLTPKGLSKVNRINELLDIRQRQILDGMTDDEQSLFFELLDRVMENARNMLPQREQS